MQFSVCVLFHKETVSTTVVYLSHSLLLKRFETLIQTSLSVLIFLRILQRSGPEFLVSGFCILHVHGYLGLLLRYVYFQLLH